MKLEEYVNIPAFRQAILRWFAQHGRKQLPWQQNPTPYRVWISEIMLQQTQVATVIPYFERFMAKFPTVEALAKATEDEVLHLWTGLGYYTRARQLLKAAQMIATQFQHRFPETLGEIQSLPGIGRSTAAAIYALAFQKRAAILDGNVKRVLARIHALIAWQNESRLWGIAEAYAPREGIAAYTQAMMDLGAMICTRRQPACAICPIQSMCAAHQQQQQHEFPGTKPRKVLPIKSVYLVLMLNQQGKVLLEKRPSKGIWGGLWSLPEFKDLSDVNVFFKEKYDCLIRDHHMGEPFRHTFTHYHLDITPVRTKVTKNIHLKEASCATWYDPKKAEAIGLPAPVKKLILNYANKT